MNKSLKFLFLIIFFPLMLDSVSEMDSLQTILSTFSDNEKIPILLRLAELTKTNSLENAVIHGEVTKIEIESEIRSAFCEIRIANNGKNVPQNIISRIFNEGFKHEKTANTGMGFFIVKNAMEQSKGSISVKANNPQGAISILTFRKST